MGPLVAVFLLGNLLALSNRGEPRIVEDPTLLDVARASVAGNVIRVNPSKAGLWEPEFMRFLVEHERGHLSYQDSIPGVEAELRADCWAVEHADERAIDGALRFFRRLGPLRFDAVHPTGMQREERIRECRIAFERIRP